MTKGLEGMAKALAKIEELERASDGKRARIELHKKNGAYFVDEERVILSELCEIGKNAVIYPDVIIEGKTIIGQGVILYPGTRLKDAVIGDFTEIQSSVILDSRVGEATTVGPFAYIRPGSEIGSRVKIGDFVEVKNSVVGDGTKISHLTYVGDADIGRDVNFGCGTVIVNYDGVKKYRTTVEDHAFIGCNTNLVAPVKVGKNAYTAAGSTITEDVPDYSLAIGRARQETKEDWVIRKGRKKD